MITHEITKNDGNLTSNDFICVHFGTYMSFDICIFSFTYPHGTANKRITNTIICEVIGIFNIFAEMK